MSGAKLWRIDTKADFHEGKGFFGIACSPLIEGNAVQVINQIEGILIVFVYDAVASFIILKVLDLVMGLRVPVEIEL